MFNSALVVESNYLAPFRTADWLRKMRLSEITEAADGQRAMLAIRHDHFDLVVTELKVPHATAFQIIDEMVDAGSEAAFFVQAPGDERLMAATQAYARDKGLHVLDSLSENQLRRRKAVDARKLAPLEFENDAIDQAFLLPVSLGDLALALENREIIAVFQPQHELISGKAVGAELLVRWQRPGYGVISPSVFLPVLQGTGLEETMTDQMVEHMMGAFESISDQGDMNLAINVSAFVAHSVEWAERFARSVEIAGVPSSSVTLELTEADSPCADSMLAAVIAHLRLRGFDCAIDDFGCGRSSLSRLSRVPFNKLKIDHGLFAQARQCSHASQLLVDTIRMAADAGHEIVVEGVESRDDLEWLRATKATFVQGFYFGQPLGLAAFQDYIDRDRRQHAMPRE